MSGRYITAQQAEPPGRGVAFALAGGLDPSLSALALRLTPLGAQYHAVAAFADTRSAMTAGRVAQALAAALRALLRQHLVLVAQLETQHRAGALPLQRLWLALQPVLPTFAWLADVVDEATRVRACGNLRLTNMLLSPPSQAHLCARRAPVRVGPCCRCCMRAFWLRRAMCRRSRWPST